MKKSTTLAVLLSVFASAHANEEATPEAFLGVKKDEDVGTVHNEEIKASEMTEAETSTAEGDLTDVIALLMKSKVLSGVVDGFITDLSSVKDDALIPPILEELTSTINKIIKENKEEIDANVLTSLERRVLEEKDQFISLIEEAVQKSNPEGMELMQFKRAMLSLLDTNGWRDYDGPNFDDAYNSSDYFRQVMQWLKDLLNSHKEKEDFPIFFETLFNDIRTIIENNQPLINPEDKNQDLSQFEKELQAHLPKIQELADKFQFQVSVPEHL